MSITVEKTGRHINRTSEVSTEGSVYTGVPSSSIVLSDYYTKTNLQSSGEAEVHWGNISNTPTTLGGYGITDAAPLASPTFTGLVTIGSDGIKLPSAYKLFLDSTTVSLPIYYQIWANETGGELTIEPTTTGNASNIRFKVGDNADGTVKDILYLDQVGSVGIRTITPTLSEGVGLHIYGNTAAVIRLEQSTSLLCNFEIRSTLNSGSGNVLQIGEGSDTFIVIRSDDDDGGTVSRGMVGFGFSSPLSKVCINGGLHVGGESAAGDNNILVDGTCEITGISTFTGLIKTVGGVHVGGVSDPGADNVIIDGTSIFGDDLGTAVFTDGFVGSGWKLDKTTVGLSTNYNLTLDNLTVRKSMKIYELIINQIRATNGSVWISDCCKIETVIDNSDGTFTCYIDDDDENILVPFEVGDIIRCQKWDGRNVKYYSALVEDVDSTSTFFTVSILDGVDVPETGDDVVRIGSENTAGDRQGSIYLTASDDNAPYIDVLDEVDSASFVGKTKVRLGDLSGITDTTLNPSGYGLYSTNVFLTGRIVLPNSGMTDEDDSEDSVRIYAGDTYDNRNSAPFRVTDDGSLTATGIAELGTATANYGVGLDWNVAISGADIWENANDSDNGKLYINALGYNGGATRYRDLRICDGKGPNSPHIIAEFTGASPNLFQVLCDFKITKTDDVNVSRLVVINSTGYVGINQAAPATQLVINGGVSIGDNAATADNNLHVVGSIDGATLTDGTFSVTGGVITGASGSNSQWENDENYTTASVAPGITGVFTTVQGTITVTDGVITGLSWI